MSKRKVVLVDDHKLVRAGLKALVDATTDFEVVAEGQDGADVQSLLESYSPDVLLLDISMELKSGLVALEELRKSQNSTPVIMLSMHERADYVIEALKLGANGYLLKDAAQPELELALSCVLEDHIYLSPRISKAVVAGVIGEVDADSPLPLTPRQEEILRLLALGKATKEIAWELGLSAKTIESHRAQIMDRLNIRDIAGLVRYAIRNGIIPLDDA